MSILDDVVSAAADIQDKRDLIVTDAERLDDIVNGPASGTGSTTDILASVPAGAGTVTGDFTNGGGLAAAQDGDTDQAAAACASRAVSASGYSNAIRWDWGLGVTRTIGRIRIFAPSDAAILAAAAAGTTFKLRGSNVASPGPSDWTDLYVAPAAVGAAGDEIDVRSGITITTAYRHHELNFSGDGSSALALAETELFEVVTVQAIAKVIADADATLRSKWPAPLTVPLTFDAATGAGPSSGTFRLGSATQNASIVLRVHETDAQANSAAGRLNAAGRSTNPIKGDVAIVKYGDASKYIIANYTAITDNGSDRDITIAVEDFSATSPFAAADACLLVFLPAADKGNPGVDGAGAGDVQSDDDPTVVNEILGWSTTGKHAKGKGFAALLAGAGHTAVQQIFGPWSGVALAGTTDISASNTILVKVTAGTGPITSFGTTRDGYLRIVRADVAFTVTRNATNLETPNAADVNVEIGDYLIVVRDSSEAAAKTQIVEVIKNDGRAYRGPNAIPQNLSFDGIVSPAQIAANQNDYAPTGHQTAFMERLNSDASRTITGLAAPTSGRAEARSLWNVGAQDIVLSDQDASSAAANRFLFGANFTIKPNKCILLWYDTTSSRWRSLGQLLPFGALATLDRITDIDQNLSLSGDISPAQLTANTNDWAPTGLSTATTIRASTDASRNLTGISAPATKRVMRLFNIGSNNLVLKNEDSGSTAANRFSFGADRTLAGGDGLELWYDSTSSRWRALAIVAAGGGGSGTVLPSQFDARLTPTTGVPFITTAATAVATLFLTASGGPYVSLYDGAAWNYRSVGADKTIKLTDTQTCTLNSTNTTVVVPDASQWMVGMKATGTGLPANTTIATLVDDTHVTVNNQPTIDGSSAVTVKCPANTGYDWYVKDVSGAPKLFAVARAAIFTEPSFDLQDGVVVKSGAPTYRHGGVFKTSNTDGQLDYNFSGQYRYTISNRCNYKVRDYAAPFAASGTWYKSPATGSAVVTVWGAPGDLASNDDSHPANPGVTSFGSHVSANAGTSGDTDNNGIPTPGSDGTAANGDLNITGGGMCPIPPSVNKMAIVAGAPGGRGGWAIRNRAASDLGASETVTIGSGSLSGRILVAEILEV